MNSDVNAKVDLLIDMVRSLDVLRVAETRLLMIRKKPLLDTNDLTYLFHNSSRTINRWRIEGILKGTRIKGRWYYKWAVVEPLL